MNLPEKIEPTVKGHVEFPLSMSEIAINQLINYLKEREELQHTTCRPKEEKVHIPMEKVDAETQKLFDNCPCKGRGSPKCSKQSEKIDVGALLYEYSELYRRMIAYPYRIKEKETLRMQQIINQIKDAIHENN